MSLRKR